MPDELAPNSNTGVREQLPLAGDYIAGGESAIKYREVVPSGDWTPYLPTDERQKSRYFDSVSCVTFSALNDIETQFRQQVATGNVSQENLAWLRDRGYLDAQGNVNLSDRFTSKMSGTTDAGNWLGAVGDSVRNDGVVPESVWPWDMDAVKTRQDYWAPVTAEALNLGQEFLKRFDVRYQWVWYQNTPDADMEALALYYLKLAPIQIVSKVCDGWNTENPIRACGPGTGHATLLYGSEPNQVKRIFDHYSPFRKRFTADYVLTYGFQYVLTQRAVPVLPPDFHYTFTLPIKYRERSPEVLAWQKALREVGYWKADLEPTGYFGEITKAWTRQFQEAEAVASRQEIDYVHSLANPSQVIVGPKTREVMNRLLAA